MPHTVVIENLVKIYPGDKKSPPVEAVRGISLMVEAGRFFGVLGPNGAGKTTTLGCITTLIRPTGGRVLVNGLDVTQAPNSVKHNIAVVQQERNLDGELRVREILIYHGKYFGLPGREIERRADRLLALMGLTDKAKAKPNKLSGGMQQRLMIARALIHDPKILLLDEPTNGLDPQVRRSIWELLEQLHSQGLTIILTTHYMEEADRLCDLLAIIDHGRVVAIDTPAVLKRKLPGERILDLLVWAKTPIAAIFSSFPGVTRVESLHEDGDTPDLERVRLFLSSSDGVIHKVLSALNQQGFELRHVSLSSPSLEDVYLNITGKEFR